MSFFIETDEAVPRFSTTKSINFFLQVNGSVLDVKQKQHNNCFSLQHKLPPGIKIQQERK